MVPGRQSTSALKASRATRKLANGRSGGDAKLHGEYYKAHDEDLKTRVFLADVLGGFKMPASSTRTEFNGMPTKSFVRYDGYKGATIISAAMASRASACDMK